MTETIQTAMDRLMTISVEPQDYVAEDGLLYCGSCKTPKEASWVLSTTVQSRIGTFIFFLER